jgi:hypothetical protein
MKADTMARTRPLTVLLALALASCGPLDQGDPGAGPAPADWETSTWRGAATLDIPEGPAKERDAVLTLHRAGDRVDGLLVFGFEGSESVGHALSVGEDGVLVLGEATCSPGLAERCPTIAAALGEPRLAVREEGALTRQLGALTPGGALGELDLRRDEWLRAPHDGFRPQSVGWPPCLEVNPAELRAEGTWDGRVVPSPTLAWANEPVRGVHCAWTNEGEGDVAGMECSPSAFIDTYDDPEAFTLSHVETVTDLDARTMTARFADGGREVVFQGELDAFLTDTGRYDSRQYRWRGRLVVDGALQGSFTFHSWGSDPSWTSDVLEQCAAE